MYATSLNTQLYKNLNLQSDSSIMVYALAEDLNVKSSYQLADNGKTGPRPPSLIGNLNRQLNSTGKRTSIVIYNLPWEALDSDFDKLGSKGLNFNEVIVSGYKSDIKNNDGRMITVDEVVNLAERLSKAGVSSLKIVLGDSDWVKNNRVHPFIVKAIEILSSAKKKLGKHKISLGLILDIEPYTENGPGWRYYAGVTHAAEKMAIKAGVEFNVFLPSIDEATVNVTGKFKQPIYLMTYNRNAESIINKASSRGDNEPYMFGIETDRAVTDETAGGEVSFGSKKELLKAPSVVKEVVSAFSTNANFRGWFLHSSNDINQLRHVMSVLSK